jgi:polysaccharide biosynthesis/export protein
MGKLLIFTLGLVAFALSIAAVVSAQTNEAGATAPPTAAASTQSSTTSPNAGRPSSTTPALQQRNPRYQVMRSDVLMVSFPLSTELNEVVTVQPDGYVTLASIGSVYLQGMTVPEIVDTLKKAYAHVLHDPIISVDLINFQKPYFTVSGQVGKPGQYDLRADTTVSEAIAVAGGFLPTAKTQVFFYHRVSSEWVEVKKLHVKELLHGKNVNEDVHLQPGDMVFVPEKFIANVRKYVPYSTGMNVNPSSFF